MNIEYAIDRLYDTGWLPALDGDVETLADGRRFPSVEGVQREFARCGLQLSVKQNLVFNCHRATWAPIGQVLDPSHEADDRHGTVVGSCEREAAVYALAQLREYAQLHQLAAV
jgi:hypothetical protein